MLHYKKIPDSSKAGSGRCVAFEKYDGTNLHWDWAWDGDFGWHAFGTRRDAFNLTPEGVAQFEAAHPGLNGAAQIFESTLAAGLEEVFRTVAAYQGFQELKVFTEFLGPGSFAGMHRPDEPRSLVLFDVWAEGYGMVGPEAFVADFGHLNSARVVWRGKFTGQFADDVRKGKYPVAEGVVVKGGAGGADVWMCKIKTLAYLERLKKAFAERWEDYWE